jgi:hypothetical protein
MTPANHDDDQREVVPDSFPGSVDAHLENWQSIQSPAGLDVSVQHGMLTAIGTNKEYAIATVGGFIFLVVLALTGNFWLSGPPLVLAIPMALLLSLALLGIIYLVSGKYAIRIGPKGFEFRLSFLGISWKRGLAWTNIRKLSMTRSKTMVSPSYVPDWDQVSKTVLPKIRLETNEGRWEFGGWLPDDHRRYFRDLIQFGYKAWVKAGKP